MTCIKTGAHVYLAPYDQYAYGDMHLIGNAYVFRVSPESVQAEPIRDVLHFNIRDWAVWFDRHADISTLIAHEAFVSNYGYNGASIAEATK